jgi:hypothetical protein
MEGRCLPRGAVQSTAIPIGASLGVAQDGTLVAALDFASGKRPGVLPKISLPTKWTPATRRPTRTAAAAFLPKTPDAADLIAAVADALASAR